MRSEARTVEAYLSELPEDRREALEAVREVIGQPLMYAALASQKRHMAVYLMSIYMTDEARQRFEEAYRATGKCYDVGKSCVRFRSVEDLPLPLVAEAVASTDVREFIEQFERVRANGSRRTAKLSDA
jgi:hypothetical protein